tara:strand:+ start:417 stop:665 length:249 start_codon:yes stop_codon:yes gene_type:complete
MEHINMSRLKYVIIPSNEVTDEMRNASNIEFFSVDNSKTVFDYIGAKPSCYNSYDELSKLEWNKIYNDNVDNAWNTVPEWLE